MIQLALRIFWGEEMRKLNVAIVGLGRSGRNIHGQYFLTEGKERYRVVAAVDSLLERRQEAKASFSCDVYSDYRELFARSDVDLVVNASFSHLHPSITIDLLNHGFHVLVEKPMARCRSECDAMIEASEKNNRSLIVFQNARFAPYFRKLKDILNTGVLGRIIQINIRYSCFTRRWDWQTSTDFYGGALLNTAPHPIDQALDLLGYEDKAYHVYSRLDSVNSYGNAEDFAKVLIDEPACPLIDLEVSNCDCYPEYIYYVQGSNGCLKLSASHYEYQYYMKETAPDHQLNMNTLRDSNGAPASCNEVLDWKHEAGKIEESEYGEATAEFYKNVYEHFCTGAALIVTPEQVRTQITLIETIHNKENNRVWRDCFEKDS